MLNLKQITYYGLVVNGELDTTEDYWAIQLIDADKNEVVLSLGNDYDDKSEHVIDGFLMALNYLKVDYSLEKENAADEDAGYFLEGVDYD